MLNKQSTAFAEALETHGLLSLSMLVISEDTGQHQMGFDWYMGNEKSSQHTELMT